jgi:hypothetical protein
MQIFRSILRFSKLITGTEMMIKINMITVVFFPMQKLPVKEKKKKPGIIYLSSIPEVRQFLHCVRRYR